MKVRSTVRNSTSPRRGSSVLATVWLMGCLAVSGFFGWHFMSHDNSTPTDGTVVAATANTASESPYVTKSIRDIRIGERVLAHNPKVTDLERRQAVMPDSSWRHVYLEMTKADDGNRAGKRGVGSVQIAVFSEEDVRAGKPVTDKVRLHQVVTQLHHTDDTSGAPGK
jgi:hypothetical protein